MNIVGTRRAVSEGIEHVAPGHGTPCPYVQRPPRLSKRLSAILSLISTPFADIGTDHAHLPIAAVLRGIVPYAVCCELNPGPLKIARQNIAAYGLQEQLQTRLGYGLTPLCPGEVPTIVISGMGGMNIIEILQRSPEVVSACKTLILQPQRDLQKVKDALAGMGFAAAAEVAVEDRGRGYFVLVFRKR